MDLRPFLEGNKYPMYIDGIGWTDESSRNSGYCPICNPKNYDDWIKKIEIEAERKQRVISIEEEQKIQAQRVLLEDQQRIVALLDQITLTTSLDMKSDNSSSSSRNISNTSLRFEYSNGDIYEGSFLLGLRSGYGVMHYADGSVFEGNWLSDKRSGFGKMNWQDGISYCGDWGDDKMNGQGRYIMADGTILEGIFKDDEIVDS